MLKDKELERLKIKLKSLRKQYDNCQYFYSNCNSDGGVTITKKEKIALDNLGTLISDAETSLYNKEQELEKYHKESIKRVAKANELLLELESVVTKGNPESNSIDDLKMYKEKADSMSTELSYARVMTDDENAVFNKINKTIKIISLKIESLLKKENKDKFIEIKSFIKYLDNLIPKKPLKDRDSVGLNHILEKNNEYTNWGKNRKHLNDDQKKTLYLLDEKIIPIQQEMQARKIATTEASNNLKTSAQTALNIVRTKKDTTYPDSLKKYMRERLIKLSESQKSAVTDVVANLDSQKKEKEIPSNQGSLFYKLVVEGIVGYSNAIVKHPVGKLALAISKVLMMKIESTLNSKAKSTPPRNLKVFEADWRNSFTNIEREANIIHSLQIIRYKTEFKDPVKAEKDYKKLIDDLSINKAIIRRIITEAWIKASKDGPDNKLNTEFNSKAGFFEISTHVTFSKNPITNLLQGISWTNTVTRLNDVDNIKNVKKALKNLGIAPSIDGDKNLPLSTLELETCVKINIGAVDYCDSEHHKSSDLQLRYLKTNLGLNDKDLFFIRRKKGNWEISPKPNKTLQTLLESFKTDAYKHLKIDDIILF